MKSEDIGALGCCSDPATGQRCDAALPDNPQCAPNYHFGMLLGVDDFRAEQGFHTGRLRRHQRLLHGAGVIAGFTIDFATDTTQSNAYELRVGPGEAVDALGRDLVLEVAQCVSLPLWWAQRVKDKDPAFADITTPGDATFDLDVMLCYGACLGSPVPAIAAPCAGDAADVAYSRICETVSLSLQRTPITPAAAPAQPYHLLQMWLGLVGPRLGGDGNPLAADQWLIDRYNALKALPVADQLTARSALLREVLVRAVAEVSADPPPTDDDLTGAPRDPLALCLPLARLHGVHLLNGPSGASASIASIELGVRTALLPTSLLQTLLLADPPPQPAAAGPVVIGGGATLAGSELDLVFSQALAASSLVAAAFAASEFVIADGWKPFTLAAVAYDDTDPARPTVRLTLDRAPVGTLVRASVIGSGSAPLLGAMLIPAGALEPDSDGRTLTTTIHR